MAKCSVLRRTRLLTPICLQSDLLWGMLHIECLFESRSGQVQFRPLPFLPFFQQVDVQLELFHASS